MAEHLVIPVQLFARLREVCGDATEVPVEVEPPVTAGDCFDALCDRFPAAGPFRESLAVAVNDEYASWDEPVGANDRVALIPPVSGG